MRRPTPDRVLGVPTFRRGARVEGGVRVDGPRASAAIGELLDVHVGVRSLELSALANTRRRR